MNLVPKPPYQHLADELRSRRPENFEDPLARDEHDEHTVNRTFQQMMENGGYSRIEKICREWLSKVERKDLVG
jgi:ABC-type amino acid transport substrate-binding protein